MAKYFSDATPQYFPSPLADFLFLLINHYWPIIVSFPLQTI